MSLRSFVPCALALALALPAAARQVRVFASTDGQYQGEKVYPNATTPQVLPLYMDIDPPFNSSGSAACRTSPAGTGDEVCAYDLVINIEGGASSRITQFTGASGTVDSYPTDFNSSAVKSLGIAFVGVASPASPQSPSLYIGSLHVDPAASPTRVIVAGQSVVDAALASQPVPTATLATLPEPGFVLQLASSALALALLRRLRRRNGR